MNNSKKYGIDTIGISFAMLLLLLSCSSGKDEVKEEQIRALPESEAGKPDSISINSIQGNLSLNQISSAPNSVVLTGLNEHRLVTVYKSRAEGKNKDYYRSYDYSDWNESEREEHFMPGIDLIHGYNLLNIAHYDLKNEQLNFLFDHPVLVKSLYYPSFIQDSLYEKPINRDYYLVSVYDADTNMDTLINKKDLRKFYSFAASGRERIQLVPAEYSVVRSQYDPKNDVMYIFAQQDTNGNGAIEKKEPMHIFWFSMKMPEKSKRLY